MPSIPTFVVTFVLPSGSRVVPPDERHARQRLEAGEQIAVERQPVIGRLVFLRQRDLQREQVVRTEARIDREHREEAAQQQPRAERQHDRQRDFRDDQRAAQPALAAPGGGAAARRPSATICSSGRDAASAGTIPIGDTGEKRQDEREAPGR